MLDGAPVLQCVSGSLCVRFVLISTYTTHFKDYESDGKGPGFCLDCGVFSSRYANCNHKLGSVYVYSTVDKDTRYRV